MIEKGSFEGPDRNTFVIAASVASAFARMGADAAADTRERVLSLYEFYRFLIAMVPDKIAYFLNRVSCRTVGLAGRGPRLKLQ
jgi:hypothetical protein